MKLSRIIPLLLLLIWQSGCISIFADRKVYVEKDKSFSGIEDDQADSVNIFITHGIGVQSDNFDVDLIQGLFTSLGDPNPVLKIDTSFLVNVEDSIIATYRLYHSAVLDQHYRIFSLNWSRFNQSLRDYFVHPSGKSGVDFDKRREKNIASVKKLLLTDGVIDLVRYTDPNIQAELHGAFFNVIARMFLKQPLVPNDKVYADLGTYSKLHELEDFYFITGSLGSKVTFDVIAKTLKMKGHRPTARFPKVRLHQYMLSNQLAYLQYINTYQTWNMQRSRSTSASFLSSRIESVELIAFNDPNDVLGFCLPEKVMARYPKVSVVNVSIRNANGLIANPAKAHDHAKLNPKIHRMIAKGSDAIRTHPMQTNMSTPPALPSMGLSSSGIATN